MFNTKSKKMKLGLKILSLLLVFALVSCGGNKDEEAGKEGGTSATGFQGILAGAYNSMEDAVAVITIDIESLKEKSNLKEQLEKQIGPNPQIEMGLQQLEGLLGKLHIIASVKDIDPKMEEQPKGKAIVVTQILDSEKFNGILAMSPMGESGEKHGYKVMDLGTAILAYTDEVLFVFADPEGDVNAMMEAALTSSNTEINPLLAKSIEASSDISIYANNENFMSMYADILKGLEVQQADMDAYMGMYKGTSTVVEMLFENGKFTTTIYNDVAEKGNMNFLADAGLSKEQIGMIANNPAGIFSMHVKWQEMWEMVKNFVKKDDIAKIDQELSSVGMTFEQMMGLFDGRMAVAYNGMLNQEKPKLGFYVGINDPKKIEEILPADEVTKDESGIYSIKDKMFLYFGDDYAIFHSDKDFISAVVGGTKGEINLGDQESILSSPINYYVNFEDLMSDPIVAQGIGIASPEAKNIMSKLDKAYGYGSADRFDYVLETKDKDRNILVQIIEAVSEAVSMMNNDVADYSRTEALEEEF